MSSLLTAKPRKLDVLAIAAHPDDVEITCGGLLIKQAQTGRAVGVIDLTSGEMGTLGNRAERLTEAEKAAKVMGLAYRHVLGLPDTAVTVTQESKLALASLLRHLAPELVILPHWEQRHPDHLAACRLGYDACFFAGLKKLPLDGEPTRPRKIIYASYYREDQFSFLVDISAQMAQKEEAIACYHSQFGDVEASKKIFHSGGQDVFSLIRARSADLGYRVGVQFAEAYVMKDDFLIEDPFHLAGKSI